MLHDSSANLDFAIEDAPMCPRLLRRLALRAISKASLETDDGNIYVAFERRSNVVWVS